MPYVGLTEALGMNEKTDVHIFVWRLFLLTDSEMKTCLRYVSE